MRSETVMIQYQDIVFECQNCYTICRLTDAANHLNCPACGLRIRNWDELKQLIREHAPSLTYREA